MVSISLYDEINSFYIYELFPFLVHDLKLKISRYITHFSFKLQITFSFLSFFIHLDKEGNLLSKIANCLEKLNTQYYYFHCSF